MDETVALFHDLGVDDGRVTWFLIEIFVASAVFNASKLMLGLNARAMMRKEKVTKRFCRKCWCMLVISAIAAIGNAVSTFTGAGSAVSLYVNVMSGASAFFLMRYLKKYIALREKQKAATDTADKVAVSAE